MIRLGQGSIFHALIQLSLLFPFTLIGQLSSISGGAVLYTQHFFVCNLFREYPSFSIYHVLTSVFGRKEGKAKKGAEDLLLGLDTNLMIYEQRKITDRFF